MKSRVVIVDPHENQSLAELADLSGVPWVRVRAWPFAVAAGDRVVTSIPVPAGARDAALGVLTGAATMPALDEVWPDLTVVLDEDREQILAHMGGSNVAAHTRVGVVGIRGGVGTSYLAACIGRVLAHHPLSVALVSDDPHSPLPDWTKTPDTWAGIDADGPLLPNRLTALAPQWRRVRLLAGSCPSRERARTAGAAFSRCHDVVIEDRGRLVAPADAEGVDLLAVIFSGDRSDLHVWDALADEIECPVLPVARTHPTGTVCSAADLADVLRVPVVTYAHEKGARIAPGRGGEPGDCRRGSGVNAASEIAARVLELL